MPLQRCLVFLHDFLVFTMYACTGAQTVTLPVIRYATDTKYFLLLLYRVVSHQRFHLPLRSLCPSQASLSHVLRLCVHLCRALP